MEILSCKNGVVTRAVSTAGYGTYVGNENYGSWQEDDSGEEYWEFYGKYAMLSAMLGMGSSYVYRDSYTTYRRYYYGKRHFYGSSYVPMSTKYRTSNASNATKRRYVSSSSRYSGSSNASSSSYGGSSSSSSTSRSGGSSLRGRGYSSGK